MQDLLTDIGTTCLGYAIADRYRAKKKGAHPMPTYKIKMQNPKTQNIEVYHTEAATQEELGAGLRFWQDDAGYTILSCEEVSTS